MENQRPLILVSNDDGVIAKGISELVKFLRPLGEIVVMAPDAPRSGSASALTVTEPIHYQLVRKDVGLTVYKCSGTPVDCIKLALHTVLDRKPDLIVEMQYLWKFVWKFGAFAMLIVIGSMSFTQKISLVRVMEGVLLFWAGPMLIGYIELKESLFCR